LLGFRRDHPGSERSHHLARTFLSSDGLSEIERADCVDLTANNELGKPSFRADMTKLLESRLDTPPIPVVTALGEAPSRLHSIVLLFIHARWHALRCQRLQSILAVLRHGECGLSILRSNASHPDGNGSKGPMKLIPTNDYERHECTTIAAVDERRVTRWRVVGRIQSKRLARSI
jgi:hypothetical protein